METKLTTRDAIEVAVEFGLWLAGIVAIVAWCLN